MSNRKIASRHAIAIKRPLGQLKQAQLKLKRLERKAKKAERKAFMKLLGKYK
tara:strand:- start:2423 stop:2578 length:156 start_codon:yes stop_codon:yes gene_type:complete